MSTATVTTRQRLLESASCIFATKGFRRATVAEICDQADANIAAVNYHFGDKAHLYEAVWRHAYEEARQAFPLDVPGDTQTTPEERLRFLIRALLNRILNKDRAGTYALIQLREMAEPTPALEQMVKDVVIPERVKLLGIIRELLGDSADEAQVALCTVSVASQCIFLSFSEPVRRVMMQQKAFQEPSIETWVQHIVEFSLAGIRHTQARTGRRA